MRADPAGRCRCLLGRNGCGESCEQNGRKDGGWHRSGDMACECVDRHCFLSWILDTTLPQARTHGAAEARGQYMITTTPTRHSAAPTMSARSGARPSIHHPHRIERTTNTPPYAA